MFIYRLWDGVFRDNTMGYFHDMGIGDAFILEAHSIHSGCSGHYTILECMAVGQATHPSV